MYFSRAIDQLRAAGEDTRLRILALLSRSDLTVSELVRCLDQLQPRVSRHLKILVEAELVEPYQEGSWRFYRIPQVPSWLGKIIDCLEGPEIDADLRALQQIRSDRADRARAYFADNAEQWNAVRRLHIDDHEIENALLSMAPASFDHFLDLGTGTGRMLALFAPRFRQATGYDASPEMLSLARVEVQAAGLTNVHLRQRDILKPDDITPGIADVVCLHHVLHFLAEPQRAFGVAALALKPGGCLLVADFAPHGREELRETYAHRRLGFSTEEIAGYASGAGLALADEQRLEPTDADGLTSVLWRFDKKPIISQKMKSEAIHA
ncbi:MAG: metalloregulator ArsR/SmtB family transcription factor [Pseudomonadota bacterium]